MISIIITAYKEPKTIGKAVKSIIDNNLKEKYEILVIAPDKETRDASKKYKNVRTIIDKGEGKPLALNLAVSKAKGEILVLTDGDVHISKNSLKPLLKTLEDKKTGAVSGRPISIDKKDTKYGFWAYLLTNIANDQRIKSKKDGKRFFCSGYLFAIRKELFPKLDPELLSEDGFISNHVYEKGYKLDYSPKSEVYIKYPNTFKDWVLQKKRSAGGYTQIKKMTGKDIRSFKKESLGALGFAKYVSNMKELLWLFQLFSARVYLWGVIYRDVKMKKKSREEIWKRVESTK